MSSVRSVTHVPGCTGAARKNVDARNNPRIKSGGGHDAYFFTRSFAGCDMQVMPSFPDAS
jgi:hypothetical protein